jgi:hypothetical protein
MATLTPSKIPNVSFKACRVGTLPGARLRKEPRAMRKEKRRETAILKLLIDPLNLSLVWEFRSGVLFR